MIQSTAPVAQALDLAVVGSDPTLLERLGERFRFLILDEFSLQGGEFDTVSTTAPTIDAGVLSGPVRRLVVHPFELHRNRITLGRSRSRSDIVIRDRRVSGAHAAIAPGENGNAWLIDLASSNGTFLESRCLAPGEAGRVALPLGATLRLGSVVLRFADHALLREMARTARR